MSDEINTDTDPVIEEGAQSVDPLNSISDIEELRAKAKGLRAERNEWRSGKRGGRDGSSASEFITKSDVVLSNEKKALDYLAASTDETDQDVAFNKDAILSFYKSPVGTPEPEEIAEALRDAHAAWRRRNPKKDTTGADAAAALQTDTGTRGQGAPVRPEVPAKDRFPKWGQEAGPEKWYPQKK